MRDLTKTLAAVTLLTPIAAHPLGLGEIELHSALNQPLNAEIALHLAAGENSGDIQVSLAPPEKFKEIGIPRSYFLSKIKFQSVVKPDGQTVIKLSSDGIIKEPYLDFLIQVSWPKGNIYREFSLLMDPPVTYEEPISPVISTPKMEYPEPVAYSETPRSSSITPLPEKSYEPRFQNLQTTEQYGPTRRNDTLWEIAQRVKSDDMSVEQMMIALYEANPKAFYKDNINNLMVGQTLKVPDEEKVFELSRQEARAEFSRQTRTWKENVAPPSSAERESVLTGEEDGSHLKLIAPSDTEVGEQEVVAAKQLEIDEAVIGELAAEQSAIDSDLAKENEEIKSRLEKLEQQLVAMQKMLALKDEQLAVLLAQNAKAARKIESKPVSPAVSPSAQQQVRPVEDTVKQAPQIQSERRAKTTYVGSDNTGYYMTVGAVGFSVLGLLGWFWWRQRQLEEEEISESMFAASSEIVLPDADQELSIPVVEEKAYDMGTAGESSFLSEFIPSDFDAFDTEHTEVDPISEADVYLAYGRYKQAEELIRQAIEEDPGRDECKLKLLEIFFANEDKASFEEYAKQLAGSGKQDDAVFWAKVAEMGNEFIPDSVLFAEDSAATVGLSGDVGSDFGDRRVQSKTDVKTASSIDPGKFNFDSDLSEWTPEPKHVTDTEGSVLDRTAANNESEPEILATGADVINTDDHEALRLDIGSELEDYGNSTGSDAQIINRLDGDAAVSLDREYHSDHTEQAFAKSPFDDEIDKDDQIEGLDFEFDLGLGSEPKQRTLGESLAASEGLRGRPSNFNQNDNDAVTDVDALDFDFNFDHLLDGDEEQDDPDGYRVGLSEMDEFETKIDLAKAYIDMGDPGAAKSLVGEVLENGSDEQKNKAKLLLETLQ